MMYGGRVLLRVAHDRQEGAQRWADEERRSRAAARAQAGEITATDPSWRGAVWAAVRGLVARAAGVASVEGR